MSVNEQWDIVSGVGITALAVAVGRAIETERADGLVDDPHAAALVEAAESSVSGALRSADTDALFRQMSGYLGIRSRFFDTWFEHATSTGIRQVVILASGLDTRAFRLNWPTGTRVFEIDQPRVLDYKDSVLRDRAVRPSCERHAIGVDLREDWATALENAGFDSTAPTAWLAEGLLPYLPATAEEELLSTVHAFSAPDSRIAIENFGGARPRLLDAPAIERASREWGIDLDSLMPDEERPDPADRLADRGWVIGHDKIRDLAEEYGRPLDGVAAEIADHTHMLTGHLLT